MKESTLTDFLDSADADVGEVNAANDANGATSDDLGDANNDDPGDANSDAVEPTVATYAWGIDRHCDDCGGSVERLWRADGDFVCPDCKQW